MKLLRAIFSRAETSVPFDQPNVAVDFLEREQRLSQFLRLQTYRQGSAIACPQVLQPLTPTLAQRLVAEHPLGAQDIARNRRREKRVSIARATNCAR